jgi:hypothetical protein
VNCAAINQTGGIGLFLTINGDLVYEWWMWLGFDFRNALILGSAVFFPNNL